MKRLSFRKGVTVTAAKSRLALAASPLVCTILEPPCSFASAHEMATAVEGSLRLAIDVVNVESSDASDNEYVTPTSTAGFHTPLASSPFFETSPCSSPLQLRASVSPLKRSLSSAEQLQEPAKYSTTQYQDSDRDSAADSTVGRIHIQHEQHYTHALHQLVARRSNK
jgi:hypothetical protein